MSEVKRVPCPQCNFQFDPVEIAKQLPPEVLIAERARRNGMKRSRVAGPGRPKGIARCPSCLGIFSLAEFRQHLIPCLTAKLQELKSGGQNVHVTPMDSAEYRDFRVRDVGAETVTLFKLSNQQTVDIPLRAIREVTPPVNGQAAVLTLRGALRWREDVEAWLFSTGGD
jgi:hypothetical protein